MVLVVHIAVSANMRILMAVITSLESATAILDGEVYMQLSIQKNSSMYTFLQSCVFVSY